MKRIEYLSDSVNYVKFEDGTVAYDYPTVEVKRGYDRPYHDCYLFVLIQDRTAIIPRGENEGKPTEENIRHIILPAFYIAHCDEFHVFGLDEDGSHATFEGISEMLKSDEPGEDLTIWNATILSWIEVPIESMFAGVHKQFLEGIQEDQK